MTTKISENLEIGAAYIRVSTDDQTELSPDAQVRVIQEEAKKTVSLSLRSSSLLSEKAFLEGKQATGQNFKR